MKLSEFREEDVFTPVFFGDLSHAYIISGPSAPAVNALTDTLAAALICSATGSGKPCGTCRHCKKSLRGIHPDITVVDCIDGKNEIQVDQIRAIRSDAVIMPNEASRRVYIVRNADTMNENAQNALLKSLEEPPAQSAFILAAGNPSLLLPTVRSRCVSIALSTEGHDASGETSDLANQFYSLLGDDQLTIARFILGLEKLDRIQFSEFINCAHSEGVKRLRSALLSGKNTDAEFFSKAVSAFEKASEYAALNVGNGHICGYLCAELTK